MKPQKNCETKDIIRALEKTKAKAWKTVALKLGKSTRKMPVVNLWKISKCTKKGDNVVVPGKVLGVGELKEQLVIAALKFSKSAREKLGKNAITITEMAEKNKEGKKIKIIT